MNILITGANGFIGQHLIENLNENHNVIELCNGKEYLKNNLKFSCNLLDKSHISSFLKEKLEIDLIIHTASQLASTQNINDLSLLYENIRMYEHLSLMITHYKPDKVINFSSIAVYPNKDGEYFEDSEIRPSKNNDCFYGLSKFCGENILDLLHKEIKIVHLRVAQVYGNGMREDRIFKVMQKELKDTNAITIYGKGRRISNFINIDTLIEKVIFFIENDLCGIFNVGDKNLLYSDLALKIIAEHGNKKSKVKLKDEGVSAKCLINTDKLKKMELKYGV